MPIILPVKKNQLIITGTVLLVLASYQFAFKNTFEAWHANKKLKDQFAQTNDVSYQPNYLNRKAYNLNTIIETYKADTSTFRNNCINKVALVAVKENVKLSDVPAPNVSLNADRLMIQRISLEGSYFSLIKVLQSIQQSEGIGFVRSASVRIMRSPGNVANRLMADVFLEIAK